MISGDLFRSRKILIRMVSFFVARSWHRGRMWKYVKQPHLRKPGQVREISDQKSTQRQRIHLWILKQPKDNGSIYETKINHGKSRVKSPGDLDFGFLEASGETWALGERSAPVSSWMVVSWVGTGMLIVGSTFERLDENNSPSTYIIMYVYIYTYDIHIIDIYIYIHMYLYIHDCAHSLLRCFAGIVSLPSRDSGAVLRITLRGILRQWMGCHCRRQSYSLNTIPRT